MSEIRATTESKPGCWPYIWLTVLALALTLTASACGSSGEPESTSSPLSPDVRATTPAWVATYSATSTLRPSPLAPAFLPTVAPRPSVTPTPFPDEQEIVAAVLGRDDAVHWVAHLIPGSFTTADADERLALVGNIGDDDEIRWVVVGQVERGGRLLGVSEWLGSGFDAPPPFYLPPDLLDFDDDGRQEVLNHYFRMQWGWVTSSDALYRWDGRSLARVWSANTLLDNRTADSQDVPQPYREYYQAEWEWVDLDGDGLSDILLREHVTFHPAGDPPGEDDIVLGEGDWERTFRWDGEGFRPAAFDGPAGTFAYTALGDLWLWRDYAARPLGVQHVREIHWSPDGQRLAWWGDALGIYDLETDTRWEFRLEDGLSALRWTPDGRLTYALPDRSPVLLDPETGRWETFPAASLGVWSPDGSQMAYERDGALYVYDLSADRERPLVVAPEGAESPAVLPSPAWSPWGDWIACYLALTSADESFTWVGLVAPGLAEPLSSFDLLETFDGQEAPEVRFAWSPDGFYLAALTADPRLAQQPTVLYLAEAPSGDGDDVGRVEWRSVLQLEAITGTVELAWSPCGDRIALVAGNEVWEVIVSQRAQDVAAVEATFRRRFSMPELEWTTLEWAPDGSGFLVGLEWVYDEHLYWFPAGNADPVLLLADSLGAARWASRTVDPRACPRRRPAMVLVEHTSDDLLFHFVDQDGSDVVVPAMGESRYASFQISGGRVYYDYRYADRSGVASLVIPNVPGSCHPPLASPDGSQLAWLCEDSPPDWSALVDGTAEIPFRLVVTDGRGRNPREVWSHVETGPDYRGVQVVSWRADGKVIYLSQPQYGAAWAYFDYNPGILALDVDTGQATQVGDLDAVHDGAVGADGAWLVESVIGEWPDEGVFVVLRSLADGTERVLASVEGATVAGDFSFSPDNTWLAWREWAADPAGAKFLIRALRLPNGEPFVVYEDAELTAPQIGGWLGRNDLVLVYPMQEDGTGGHSTIVTLPATGPGDFFSPFTFLGVLDEAPSSSRD